MRIEKRIDKKRIWIRFVDFLIKINFKVIKFNLDYEIILRDIYSNFFNRIIFFLTAVKNLSPSLISRETILSSVFLDENEKSTTRLPAHLVKAFTFMRDLSNENIGSLKRAE